MAKSFRSCVTLFLDASRSNPGGGPRTGMCAFVAAGAACERGHVGVRRNVLPAASRFAPPHESSARAAEAGPSSLKLRTRCRAATAKLRVPVRRYSNPARLCRAGGADQTFESGFDRAPEPAYNLRTSTGNAKHGCRLPSQTFPAAARISLA